MSNTDIVAFQAEDTGVPSSINEQKIQDGSEVPASVQDDAKLEHDEKYVGAAPEQAEQTDMGEAQEMGMAASIDEATVTGVDQEQITIPVQDDVTPSSVPASPAPKEGVFRRLARKMSLSKVANPQEPAQPAACDAVIEDSDIGEEAIAAQDTNESSNEPAESQPETLVNPTDFEAAAASAEPILTPSKPKSGPFKQLKDKLKGRKNRDSATFSPATSTASIPASASAIPESDAGAPTSDTPSTEPKTEYQTKQLAYRIRELIASLPAPDPDSPFPKPPRLSQLPPPKCDKSGRPIAPPSAILVKDNELLQKMRDPVIMNGKEDDEPSVWSVLQELGPDDGGNASSGNNTSADEPQDGDDTAPAPSPVPGDVLQDSSIMMYVPLEPTDDDKFELAQYQYVPLSQFSQGDAAVGLKDQPALQAAWKLQWPFRKKPSVTAPTTPSTGPTTTPSTGDTTGDPSSGKPTVPSAPSPAPDDKVVKVWLPSTTKMSIHALWWGYRLYLPPPVLSILSDDATEATKRAALVTTALTWLFNNIPVTLLPPPLQPILLLMQKIVPLVGYIGTFISWSMSQIKSYDVGYGVVLSATWLLPIALIPGTWQQYDFPEVTPGPPSTGTPVPGTTPGNSIPPTPTPSAPVPTIPTTPAAPKTPAPITVPAPGSVTVNSETTDPMKLPEIPISSNDSSMAEQIAQVGNEDEGNKEANVEGDAMKGSDPVVEKDVPNTSEESAKDDKPNVEVGKEKEGQQAETSEAETSEQVVGEQGDAAVGTSDKDPDATTKVADKVRFEKTEKPEKRKSRGIVGGLWNYFVGSR